MDVRAKLAARSMISRGSTISRRSAESTNIFKRKRNLPSGSNILDSKMTNESATFSSCNSMDNEVASTILLHTASADDSISLTVTESSEIDSCDTVYIRPYDYVEEKPPFGPNGCVCDKEAVKYLPDDWEPNKTVGTNLQSYLESTEKRQETCEEEFLQNCAEVNRVVDEKESLQLRMIDDAIKYYESEIESSVDGVRDDLIEEKYEDAQQHIRKISYAINKDINEFSSMMGKFEEERIEGLRQAFRATFCKQINIGFIPFDEIMMKINKKLKLVNEQLSYNMGTISQVTSQIQSYCKAAQLQGKAKLEEVYLKSKNATEDITELAEPEVVDQKVSHASMTKLMSSKSVPMNSVKRNFGESSSGGSDYDMKFHSDDGMISIYK